MAHYALLNSANVVTQVITGKDETDTTHNWEEYYGNFHNCTVKRTSYNTIANIHRNGGTPFRGNYAGIGSTYDVDLDVFIPPKPHNNWILSTATVTWIAPSAAPANGEGYVYMWNDDDVTWDRIDLDGATAGG